MDAASATEESPTPSEKLNGRLPLAALLLPAAPEDVVGGGCVACEKGGRPLAVPLLPAAPDSVWPP